MHFAGVSISLSHSDLSRHEGLPDVTDGPAVSHVSQAPGYVAGLQCERVVRGPFGKGIVQRSLPSESLDLCILAYAYQQHDQYYSSGGGGGGGDDVRFHAPFAGAARSAARPLTRQALAAARQ